MVTNFRLFGKIGFAIGILVCAFSVQATILNYDISISGGWKDIGSPFGMGLSPDLTGSLTVDSRQTGADALVGFSLQTGSYRWTESDIDTNDTFLLSFMDDELSSFFFGTLSSSTGFGWLYSEGTFYVNDGSQFNLCNYCVSYSSAAVAEPSSLALFGLGMTILGMARRKKAQSQ